MTSTDPRVCAHEYMTNVMGYRDAKIVDSVERPGGYMVLFDNGLALVLCWYDSESGNAGYDVYCECSADDFFAQFGGAKKWLKQRGG